MSVPSKHIIYALVDPNTHQVRYIGRTSQAASRRLYFHVNHGQKKSSLPVYKWIDGLMPQKPIIVVLQEIADVKAAREDGKYESTAAAAETKWMKRFERSQIFNHIPKDARAYKRLVNR